LKFPGSAAGFFQLDWNDVEAQAAATTAAVTTRTDRVDRSMFDVPPWGPDRAGAHHYPRDGMDPEERAPDAFDAAKP
jgi:hypothetical protein